MSADPVPPPAPATPATGFGTSAQHLAMVFNSARDMMMLAKVVPGELFRVVSVNRPYVETIRAAGFNLTAQDFEGRSFAEVRTLFGFDAATAAEIQARYEQVISTGRLLEYAEVTRTPGGVFHGRTTITPIPDATGACAYVLYASQDVTDRVRTEAALRESEEKFAKAFRASPDAISVHEMETGRYVDVNEGFLRLFGFAREDVLGRTPRELGFWSGDDSRKDFVEKLRRDGRVRHFNVKVRLRDGRVRECQLSSERIELGGRPHNVTILHDITERLQAERAVLASEDKFARAFRASPDAISISEVASGRILEVNEGFERLSGYERAELIGRTVAELGLWVDEGARERMALELERSGAVHNLQMRLRNRRGVPGDFLVSGEIVEIGGVRCLVAVSRDITERLQAEQALRESEEMFAKAFRVSPQAMSIAAIEDGRYLQINQAHQEIFGYPPEEIIGRTPVELGILADPTVPARNGERLRSGQRVRDQQLQARTRDGRIITIINNAELVRVAGKDCALLTSRDVTAQLQAEQALRESEEKFAAAFRVSPDLVSISDYATGRYVEVNGAHAAFFGYTREEMIGKSALELGLIADAGPREDILHLLERDGHVREFKVPARTRDGRDVTLALSAEVVHVQGRKCILRVSRDITAALRAEQALRESEEKFAKAFSSSPQALIITEMPSGRYVDVNLGFERITGYKRGEIVGRTALEIGIWENAADREVLMQRMQRDGWARDMEFVFRGKDGKRLITRCSFELIDLAGRKCLLSVIEDITEQRRAEEQKAVLEAQLRQNQKLEALGTLAGGIAHDFNNILTAIIVNQELALMDVAEPAEVRGRLEEIGQASNRAKDLVRQILTFSRQQQHERLRQHLQLIVREALSLLRASLPATIDIKLDLSPDAPPVLADASQIHQVVMNLCTNSAHAMQAGGGRLTVRLAPRWLDEAACRGLPGLRAGSYAQLTVTDTGHGMDAGVLARIFEPFFTTKGPGEGTGLGLPMVHGIMQDHGGGIFVQSTPGAGTTFDLYFPEASGLDSRAPHADSGIEPGRGETVLIVDDEEAICAAIGAMLRKIGYHTEVFTNPVTALERFRSVPTKFNLLLTDRTMPHLTGPALIAEARAWWPGLPAVLMSGLSSPLPAEVAADPGYELVAKPIEIAELSRVVRRALTHHPTP